VDIRSPDALGGYEDRGTGCQMALEPAVEALVRSAEDAGWKPGGISKALVYLALARLWGSDAEEEIQAAISTASGGSAGSGRPEAG